MAADENCVCVRIGPFRIAAALERLSLFLLLVVIGFRPLVQETYESAETPVSRALTDARGPGPTLTLMLDGVIVAAGVLWIWSVALRRHLQILPVGIGLGAMLIAIGGLGSLWEASDKRVAINATVDWLLLIVLAVLLRQLLKRPWQVRLAVAVVGASAAAFAVECIYQRYVTFPDTIAEYEQHQRNRMWTQRGLSPDDPEVLLFENRLHAQEVHGSFAHPNIAASYLMLTALAVLGLAWNRLRAPRRPCRRGWGIAAGAMACLIALPILWTGSKGAMAAGAMGILCFVFSAIGRRWVERNARRVLVMGWAAVVGASAVVIVQGVIRNGLPGASMGVRWMYWKAAARMTVEHPWFGVGLGNFGQHYTRYKGIESSEEVRDPHNVLAAAASQWGIPGLLGMVALFVGGSVAVYRSRGRPASDEEALARPDGTPNGLGQMAGIGGVIFLLRAATLDWGQPAYVFVAITIPLIVWVIAYVVLSSDSNVAGVWADDALSGLDVGAMCGLVAFLIHNGVDFSLFEPGPATTCFALFAVLLACGRAERSVVDRPVSGVGGWALAGGGVLAVAAWVVIARPVVLANASLQEARLLRQAGDPAGAVERFDRAARMDPLDPSPLIEAAEVMASMAVQPDEDPLKWLVAALDRVHQAVRRDPAEVNNYRRLSRLHEVVFHFSGDPVAAQAAIDAAAKAVELYPSLPAGHEQLGDALAALAQQTGDPKMLLNAIHEYETAIDLDNQRPASEIRRYPPRKREEISRKLDTLRALGAVSVR